MARELDDTAIEATLKAVKLAFKGGKLIKKLSSRIKMWAERLLFYRRFKLEQTRHCEFALLDKCGVRHQQLPFERWADICFAFGRVRVQLASGLRRGRVEFENGLHLSQIESDHRGKQVFAKWVASEVARAKPAFAGDFEAAMHRAATAGVGCPLAAAKMRASVGVGFIARLNDPAGRSD